MIETTAQRKAKRLSRRETVRRADAVIERFQRQIENQVASINRLLDNPDAATEIARLHARIADLERTLATIAGADGELVDDGRPAIELRRLAQDTYLR